MRVNSTFHASASSSNHLPKLILAIAMVLLCIAPVSAQLAGKGAIKGTITDSSGALVPNATVTATSTTRGTSLSVTSTASGDFQVTPLDPDIYTLQVKAPGFSTTTQENVHVNALEVANVNITMKVGSENESVNRLSRSSSP